MKKDKVIIQGEDTLLSKEQVLTEIGQITAFRFMEGLATVANLKIIKNHKNTKSYKGLTYLKDGKLATVTTFDEYCTYKLGVSRRTIDQKLVNLEHFGEEFYNTSQKIGIGIRELNTLRQLPKEDAAVIIESEAIEAGDKEAIKELITVLKTKHKKETSTLKEELHASDSMLKASRELSSKNIQELQELKNQLHDKKLNSVNWQGNVKEFFTAMHGTHNAIMHGAAELQHLLEELKFSDDMEDKAKDICINALYADTKLTIEALACSWKMIDENIGHLVSANKLSSEYLADLGFEIND